MTAEGTVDRLHQPQARPRWSPIADRVTVMRRGRVTAAGIPTAETTTADLARLMVGREVLETIERTQRPAGPGRPRRAGRGGGGRPRPAGAPGHLPGRSARARSSASPGSPATASRSWPRSSPACAPAAAGRSRSTAWRWAARRRATRSCSDVAHVPEDRTGVGSAPNLSVADNLIMKSYRDAPVARRLDDRHGSGAALREPAPGDVLDRGAVDRHGGPPPLRAATCSASSWPARSRRSRASWSPSSPPAASTSGPSRPSTVSCMDQRAAGAATILISEDLDEVLAAGRPGRRHVRGPPRRALRRGGRRRRRDRPPDDGRPAPPASGAGRRAGRPVTATAPTSRPARAGGRRGWSLRLERRLEIPRWLPAATTARRARRVARSSAAIILWFAGGDPVAHLRPHRRARLRRASGVLSDTLVKATPLILTGLACALAFRMRLWNIGAEGQFLMGAWGASRRRAHPDRAGRHAGDRHAPPDDGGRPWPPAPPTARSRASSRPSAG